MSRKCPPQASDFDKSTHVSIVSSPNGKAPANVLVLLHGLGDSDAAMATLGRAMNLPETVCVAVRGHAELPFADVGKPAFHWGDDVVFDPDRPDAGVDVEAAGYSTAVGLVGQVVGSVLVGKCGFRLRDVVVMGLGQGGTVALGLAQWIAAEQARGNTSGELGGIVSLGGAMPHEWRAQGGRTSGKSATPVLVCHGKSASAITTTRANEIKAAFQNVEIKQWPRAGDGMATNRDEMLPIMRFFSRRLQSNAGVPAGAVEIG